MFYPFTDGNDGGCLGANYCPPECTCTGTIVRCSHAKLTSIPKVATPILHPYIYTISALANTTYHYGIDVKIDVFHS